MLFGKLISLVLVTAILNPVCCCNAELLAGTQPTRSLHECCTVGGMAGDDASEQESTCESEDECPLKLESLSQKAQQVDLKNPTAHAPLESGLLPSWLGISVIPERANARSANGDRARQWDYDSQERLRLHQAKCVYLI